MRKRSCVTEKASLTVEAALVMPFTIYFFLAFLYFIQIVTIQERLQAALTTMGLSMAKYSFVFDKLTGEEEKDLLKETDDTEKSHIGLEELSDAVLSSGLLKLYLINYIDIEEINQSCIKNGYEGISFLSSDVLDEEDGIDIIASYNVKIPIHFFVLKDLPMRQRVRLRGWTGHRVPAKYKKDTTENAADDPVVYITETGTVYHTNPVCRHIKISVRSVIGVPLGIKNDNGAYYYPCESCCKGTIDDKAVYYITSDGTRYHSKKDCSKIKRTVKEVHLSEVSDRRQCKNCKKEEK